MTHRTVSALPALALLLAAGVAVGGCTAPASAGGAAAASSPASAAARTSAGVQGPVADPACAAALAARQALEARQGKDQGSQSAIDQDFTNFATALSNAAQQEKDPAKVQAMTALANDYTALVQSQSGATQLPDMSTVQSDGAAFDKACP